MSAERLHANHRADHVAVDVNVADIEPVHDSVNRVVDARMNAERQAIAAVGDGLQYVREVRSLVAGHMQDRAEHFLGQVASAAQDVFAHFAAAVKLAPEVLDMVAGGFDYLVKARVADMTAYRRFLGDILLALPGVKETRTYAVMEEIKRRCAVAFVRNSVRDFALSKIEKIRHSAAASNSGKPVSVMSRKVLIAALFAGLVSSSAPAAALQLTPQQADLYTSVSINPPSVNGMTVCYGFVCRRREMLNFTASDQKQLSQIMAKGKASAVAERAAIQKAVVWFDKRMGPMIGTTKRVARADIRAGADAGNYDCWDSTRNVSSLLLVMQEWGLLKHHTVSNPRYRGNILVMQLPHNTAVVMEKNSRVEWAVDMWTTRYAQPPDVMLVDQWLKEE